MLASKYRFKLRGQSAFFQEATKQRVQSVVVLSKKNNSGFCVTCIIPKRVVALATKRNRMKRVLYQVIQNNLGEFQKFFISLVVIVQQPITETNSTTQMNTILKGLQQQYGIHS